MKVFAIGNILILQTFHLGTNFKPLIPNINDLTFLLHISLWNDVSIEMSQMTMPSFDRIRWKYVKTRSFWHFNRFVHKMVHFV